MSATNRSRPRARHTGRHALNGLVNSDGELTAHGERYAEYREQARAGYWDPPGDDAGPDGYGWGIDPGPDSAVA